MKRIEMIFFYIFDFANQNIKNVMKKNAHLLVFLLPLYLLLSNASGAPFGYSGSPGDNGRTCNQCHSYSGSGYSPTFDVTGIPTNGYQPGQTYQLTLSVSNVNTAKKGFEACVEDASHQKQGTFSNADGNTQPIQSNTYITHTSAGNTQSQWTFNWTAPATAQGDLTLYFAVNMANGNGSTSGDYVQASSVSIPEDTNAVQEIADDQVKIYPNPADNFIKISTNDYRFDQAEIKDVLGKTYPVNIKNNQIDVSFLPAGTYFLELKNAQYKSIKQFIKK